MSGRVHSEPSSFMHATISLKLSGQMYVIDGDEKKKKELKNEIKWAEWTRPTWWTARHFQTSSYPPAYGLSLRVYGYPRHKRQNGGGRDPVG